jgi:hypothetical protein
MPEKIKNEFGSVDETGRFYTFFRHQIGLLEKARQIVMQEEGEPLQVVIPLLYSVIETSDSISFLAQKGKIRDCFVLARTAFETIVNLCFIFSEGDKAIKRTKQHAQQKAYRDLNRDLDIAGNKIILKWNGVDKININAELQSAIMDFTSRKGKEITSWTPETVKNRIENIKKRFGDRVATKLQFPFFAIYRHASEISHGTFFGALFALGLTSPTGPPRSHDDLQKYVFSNLSMLLMLLGYAISALISVLSEDISLIGELATQSDKAVSEFELK